MPTNLSHKERINAIVKGGAIDRPGVSMWGHFFEKETTAEGLAEAMLGFQRKYDWDFMKVNPRASYHSEVWGCSYRYPGGPQGQPVRVSSAVKTTADWAKIEPMSPDAGPLGEQLKALKLIKQGLGDEAYFIETIFNPLSVLGRVAESDEMVLRDLRENREAILPALEAITQTFAGFARACLDAGADGIFFATTGWGTYDVLTDAEYDEFARPYDLRVLDAVQGAPFNVLHVCRGRNMLYALQDYPVAAVNWDTNDRSNPSLGEAAHKLSVPPIGGISQVTTLSSGTPDELVVEAKEAARQVGSKRWILGPGCSIPTDVPEANLRAVRDVVNAL